LGLVLEMVNNYFRKIGWENFGCDEDWIRNPSNDYYREGFNWKFIEWMIKGKG